MSDSSVFPSAWATGRWTDEYVYLLLPRNRLRNPLLYSGSKFQFTFWGKPMKHILIASAAIASLLTTNALAADLAPRTYTKAPVIAAVVYDWTGFYIGGNAGYSWGRERTDGTLTGTQNVSVFRTAGPTLISSVNTVLGGLPLIGRANVN